MVDLEYAQYRDWRGHIIEATRTGILRRRRFIVWKDRRRLGAFGSAIEAERFIELRDEASA